MRLLRETFIITTDKILTLRRHLWFFIINIFSEWPTLPRTASRKILFHCFSLHKTNRFNQNIHLFESATEIIFRKSFSTRMTSELHLKILLRGNSYFRGGSWTITRTSLCRRNIFRMNPINKQTLIADAREGQPRNSHDRPKQNGEPIVPSRSTNDEIKPVE